MSYLRTLGGVNTSGDATFSGNVVMSDHLRLTSAAGGNVNFNGVISGSSNLTKIGSGTVTLNGTNTYTGTTTVSNGTLVVDGKLAGGAVTVDAGATLMGSGIIGGATTVNGNLNSGNSPGTLTFNNALNLEDPSVTTIQIASNVLFDVLKGATSNTLTFASGSDLIFDFTGNTTVSNGSSFVVLQNWSSIVTNGANFATVGLDANLTVDLSALVSGGILTVNSATPPEQYTTNGTPYSWLDQYGLTNYVADDVLDQDTDGLKTWQEYIAGTDPTNTASVLKVVQTIRNVVTWTAQSNRTYSVYWSTNLVKGFSNLVNNATSPYTNTAPDSRANHYQVRVRLQ
jgi:autotransporter-associated beta strand protein